MKIIKFNLSNGESISLPYEQAERVLNASGQLVRILDANGAWSGKTINQAHIVSTLVDSEASQAESIPNFSLPQLQTESEEQRVGSIKSTLDKKRQELKERGIIK